MKLLMECLKGWFHTPSSDSLPPEITPRSPYEHIAEVEARCADLEQRLSWSDEKLKERTELLYDLQRQYSTEHFSLYESVRDLNTERLRNVGAYASLDTILDRARGLQERVRALKQGLRKHESVEDRYFDDAPIFIEGGKQ